MTPEILISLPVTKPSDLDDNRNVARAAFSAMGQCRLRLSVAMYAPGTTSRPKPRYYWVLGSSATITCKTPAALDHVMKRLQQLTIEMNGWSSEKEASSAK
jgi:hypothetical protein